MKQFIKFKKINGSCYLKEANTQSICILGIFLGSEVAPVSLPFYRDWAKDQNQQETGGNATWLIKEDNNIIISELYSESSPEDNSFIISIEEFIKLLNDWEKLQKNGPGEIIITYEDGKILIQEIN